MELATVETLCETVIIIAAMIVARALLHEVLQIVSYLLIERYRQD